ncbi:PIR protein [Plasmodium ovale]|uniref:PIR protein n=1 Tax=Plasmodium ovale TaxID=36330 RepID=A0A1C3KKK1_PLAOA|nr:PIR protein [Plasmodium ovale]
MSNLKEDIIYTFPRSFPSYKDKLDSIDILNDASTSSYCNLDNKDKLVVDDNSLPKNCAKVLQYLSHLKGYDNPSYIAPGCIYLYYWIYYDVLGDNKSCNNTFKLFEKFKTAFDEIEPDAIVCDGNIENISDESFQKLKHLYDLYDNLKKFKEKSSYTTGTFCDHAKSCFPIYKKSLEDCHSDTSWNFCYELEKFREEYNETIQREPSCIGQLELLPSTKKYDIVVILIPFVIVLIITFILFILYKFTPIDLWLCTRIRRKNIWNKLDEEDEQFKHNSNIRSINQENASYNMLYHSTLYR